jgi:hypothetical protein
MIVLTSGSRPPENFFAAAETRRKIAGNPLFAG